MSKRILIIGSGAVGAVYAQALVKAGCQVTFLVRDKSSPNAAMPRQLHRYGLTGKPRSEKQHLRTVEEAGPHYDQVWLCTPSTALHGDWLKTQIRALGPNTELVCWTPDIADMELLAELHNGPLAQGLIGLISFQTPLPEEDTPSPGIGYYLPPGSAVLDSTPAGTRAAALLRAGGVPTDQRQDLAWWEARLASVTICAVAALEHNAWSLKGLRRSPDLALACAAAREAMAVNAASLGVKPGLAPRLPLSSILRFVLTVGPRVMPFSLETYLHYHFSKVGDQTRQVISSWIERGNGQQQQTASLQALRAKLA